VIYSSSCEYAIRALTYLAREQKKHETNRKPDDPLYVYIPISTVAERADEERLPQHFLAKIMQTLARSGVLGSQKGPKGGFSLARPAAEITLYDIVEALDDLSNYNHCAVGLTECNDEAPCPLHNMWVGVRTAVLDYFRRTTLVDLATAVEEKKAIRPSPPAA
jgi:Rrf2 family protein